MNEVRVGQGVIRARGQDAWEIKIDRPRARGQGRRTRIYETVRGSRIDAEARLAALRQELEQKQAAYVEPSKLTVEQWLERWLENYANGVSAKTRERYIEICRRHIIPALGGHRLVALTTDDVQEFYRAKQRDRRRQVLKGGRIVYLPPLSAQTLRHIHRVFFQALKQAQISKLIAYNPALGTKRPPVQPPEMATLDEAQTAALIGAAIGTALEIVVLLAATCGLRRSEILGLRWRDLDLKKGDLKVVQVLEQTASEGLVFKSPKTKQSRRTLPLVPFTIEPLNAHRARQLEQRVKAGSMWEANDLVCCHADGTPLNPRQVTKNFAALVKRLGLPIRLHDLRHTHLSQLLAAGENVKVVSERAGHANAFITLTTYAHTKPGMQQQAVNRLDAALRPYLKG